MKRIEDISRLKKNRFAFFQIGFIVAVGFAIVAFNYTTDSTQYQNSNKNVIFEDEMEIERTVQQPERPLPPPPPEDIPVEIDPVDEVVEFSEDPIVEVKEPIQVPQNTIVQTPDILPAPIDDDIDDVEEPDVIPTIFTIVEEMPKFVVCDAELTEKEQVRCAEKALLEYIYSEIKYPTIARENGIKGTVIVQFVINEDGSISAAKIMRDIGGGCGEEVLRVIEKMENWVPGKQRNKPVKVRFNLPVRFKIM